MGYKIIRAVLNFIFFVIFRLHVEGRENVPPKGAIIVAPNHKSDWDPPLIGVAFDTRIIHYMAKEELFKNPIFGWIIRQFGTFPVKRGAVDRTAIRQAIRELKAGNPLGIFPEGTRIRREVPVKKQRPTDELVAELNEEIKGKIQQLMDEYQAKIS